MSDKQNLGPEICHECGEPYLIMIDVGENWVLFQCQFCGFKNYWVDPTTEVPQWILDDKPKPYLDKNGNELGFGFHSDT